MKATIPSTSVRMLQALSSQNPWIVLIIRGSGRILTFELVQGEASEAGSNNQKILSEARRPWIA